eukprot:1159330-Pelagomonas_calceolata.AAC.5
MTGALQPECSDTPECTCRRMNTRRPCVFESWGKEAVCAVSLEALLAIAARHCCRAGGTGAPQPPSAPRPDGIEIWAIGPVRAMSLDALLWPSCTPLGESEWGWCSAASECA